MSRLYFAWICVGLFISSSLLLSGCGGGSFGPTVSWSGKVTLKGAEIPSGAQALIIVQSAGEEGQAGSTQAPIENGYYSLKDVPKGRVCVQFSITQQKPSTRPEDAGRGIMDSTELAPKKWQEGVEQTADSNDSNKNFDIDK